MTFLGNYVKTVCIPKKCIIEGFVLCKMHLELQELSLKETSANMLHT